MKEKYGEFEKECGFALKDALRQAAGTHFLNHPPVEPPGLLVFGDGESFLSRAPGFPDK